MIALLVVVALVVLVVALASRRSPGTGAAADRRVLSAADLRRATESGVVTADQATALLALAAAPPPPTGAGRRASRRTPVAVEIVGYLGGVLTVIGAATLVGQFWEDMAAWSRLALIGALAVGLWGAGAVVDDSSDAALWRLRGVLWLLSSAAAAFFAGLLAADVFAWDREPVAVFVGSVAAVYAGALWRLGDRPAQYLATVAGVVAALAGAGAWIDGPGMVGLVLWAFGAVWLVAGWRQIIQPAAIALVAAPGLMLVAAGVTGGSWESFAPLFGLITAAGLLVGGTVLKEFLVTGIGVAGVFVYLPMSAAEYFGEVIGVPIVLLVTGVLLIGLMVLLLRRGAGPRPLLP
ncbi:MAG TPA: hypothetical protein VFI47_05115 [Acidimicrobiales bacterium]|nr:hypothetical protein [Acidimicrobiales bacterium]